MSKPTPSAGFTGPVTSTFLCDYLNRVWRIIFAILHTWCSSGHLAKLIFLMVGLQLLKYIGRYRQYWYHRTRKIDHLSNRYQIIDKDHKHYEYGNKASEGRSSKINIIMGLPSMIEIFMRTLSEANSYWRKAISTTFSGLTSCQGYQELMLGIILFAFTL